MRLPPLTTLRTFEAAGRLSSFTRAAEELHVTQSAVSRQIRALEDDLGVTLFRRSHRKVRLTGEGARLLPVLSEAFGRIGETVDGLRTPQRDVKLKVPPTFAIRWLIPRLEAFQRGHPDIQVRLTSGIQEVKLGKEPFDMGVVYGRHGDSGRKGDVLLIDRVVPVAAPRYLEHAPPLAEPRDLRRHVLLIGDASGWDWRRWARVFDVDDLPLEDGLHLELAEAALQAASSGQGVALATTTFVVNELESGRLLRPLATPPLEIGTFRVVYARGARTDACVQRFREWLLDAVDGGCPPAQER